jgi:hypothetical protein
MMKAVLIYLLAGSAHAAPDGMMIFREQAREIVKSISCGGCHTPFLPTTKERALKVYNLAAPYWSATMTDRQLADFKSRLKGATTIEQGGRTPGTPSEAQLQTLLKFVEKEQASRRADPTERFRQLQETKFPDFYQLFSGVTP